MYLARCGKGSLTKIKYFNSSIITRETKVDESARLVMQLANEEN